MTASTPTSVGTKVGAGLLPVVRLAISAAPIRLRIASSPMGRLRRPSAFQSVDYIIVDPIIIFKGCDRLVTIFPPTVQSHTTASLRYPGDSMLWT